MLLLHVWRAPLRAQCCAADGLRRPLRHPGKLPAQAGQRSVAAPAAEGRCGQANVAEDEPARVIQFSQDRADIMK